MLVTELWNSGRVHEEMLSQLYKILHFRLSKHPAQITVRLTHTLAGAKQKKRQTYVCRYTFTGRNK